MVVVPRSTLGKLDGDVGSDRSLGGRCRTRRLEGDLPHNWRGAGDMDVSIVGAGH